MDAISLQILFECSRQAVKDKILVLSPGDFFGNSKYIYSYLHKKMEEAGSLDHLYYICHSDEEKERLSKFGIKAHHSVEDTATMKLMIETSVVFMSTHHLARADYCVLQAAISGAVKVQMWHGLPAKKVAYEVSGSRGSAKQFAYFAYDCLSADYFVADSEYVAERRQAAFPAAKPIVSGTPRTDILVGSVENFPFWNVGLDNELMKIMEDWRNTGKIVALYTPTYRQDYQVKESYLPEMKRLFYEVSKNSEILLVFKNHPSSDDTLYLSDYAKSVCPDRIFVMNSKDDVYPYFKETDVLITDYSSIYYDFLLMGRKVIFFRPDYEQYTTGREIYDEQNISSAPMGENVKTGGECVAAINSVEPESYFINRSKLRNKLFSMADGSSSERLVNEICKHVPGTPLECLK